MMLQWKWPQSRVPLFSFAWPSWSYGSYQVGPMQMQQIRRARSNCYIETCRPSVVADSKKTQGKLLQKPMNFKSSQRLYGQFANAWCVHLCVCVYHNWCYVPRQFTHLPTSEHNLELKKPQSCGYKLNCIAFEIFPPFNSFELGSQHAQVWLLIANSGQVGLFRFPTHGGTP